jgi:hypothetical protein
MYSREEEMYPDVKNWLKWVLAERCRGWEVFVEDTSRTILSKSLRRMGLHVYFPLYTTFEVKVDITGVVRRNEEARLVLVECKLKRITLGDLSQLLGYSLVVSPAASIIVSPEWLSDGLNQLLNVYGRNEVLEYGKTRRVTIAKWDKAKQDIDYNSIIPKGADPLNF